MLTLFGPLPALVALAVATAVEAVPMPSLLAIAIIAYAVLVAGTMEARKDARKNNMAAPSARPSLELMNTIPLATATAIIEVARSTGECPLGFNQRSAWIVYKDGQLTYPLCRPAVEALGPVLRGGIPEADKTEIPCQCPLSDREVVFTVAANGWHERSAPIGAVLGQAPGPEQSRAA